ncbi:MAG: SMP-30/gluconolactonase/LRE family protein, partial [Acidobacteriota bacterium]|nr:SMP-30/gluconolactonase/LRE family protein [Acidobacteriota bacterium]
FEGSKLTSPNDLAYKSDGSLYFTDPPYGTRTQSDQDPQREQPVNGVYRILGAVDQKPGAAPDQSKLRLIIKDLPRPNGIAFSPDEKTLYVSNSQPKFWKRYPVNADGTVGPGMVLYDAAKDTRAGAPDGIKVDTKGNLWGAGPGGVWIFSPEGKHIGTVNMPETVGNLAWGGPDAKTLYITASSSIYALRVSVPGLRPSEFR